MTSIITHKYVSTIPDSGDTTVVQPTDWNDDHNINLSALADQILPNMPISGNATLAAAAGWSFYPIYNSTGGLITINLPANPIVGQLVSFADALQNAASHTIIISGNGKNIAAFTGIASTTAIQSNGGTINPLLWDSANNKWVQFG